MPAAGFEPISGLEDRSEQSRERHYRPQMAGGKGEEVAGCYQVSVLVGGGLGFFRRTARPFLSGSCCLQAGRGQGPPSFSALIFDRGTNIASELSWLLCGGREARIFWPCSQCTFGGMCGKKKTLCCAQSWAIHARQGETIASTFGRGILGLKHKVSTMHQSGIPQVP